MPESPTPRRRQPLTHPRAVARRTRRAQEATLPGHASEAEPRRARGASSDWASTDWAAPETRSTPAADPTAAPPGRIPYMPALDGLRAIALVTVLAFHGGFTVVHGGYLPLTAFFVLSGFLITALLLSERTRRGGTALGQFWIRRAKRLVPAAVLGIGLAAVYVQLAGDRVSQNVRGDGFASLFWVANWRFIATKQTYADTFSDPSPFQHYWSLAVEEQFYLVLPVLFVGAIALARGRRWLFTTVVAALVAASTVWMAYLHQPGDAPLRTYFGTDTRGAELLVGVLLAVAMVDGRGSLRRFRGAGSVLVDGAGFLALITSVTLWFVTREFDDRLYEGGLLGISLLAAVVVVAATQPTSLVTRILSWRPLAWLGRLSYGVYLFHWPIFLYLSESRTGLDVAPLFALRMAITLGLAWLSLRFIENPIRHGTMPRFVAPVGWANATVATAAVVAAFATGLVPSVTLTTGAQEGQLPPPPPITDRAARTESSVTTTTVITVEDPSTTTASDDTTPTTTATGTTGDANDTTGQPGANPTTGRPGATAPGRTPASSAPPTTAPPTTQPPPPAPLRIMVVGDSVARNLATGLLQLQQDGANISVYDSSILGCTISRGGTRILDNGRWPVANNCGFWATSSLDSRLADFAPDIVVVHSGINEMYDREHPSWTGVKGPGDPTFDAFIRSEWTQALNRYGSSGAKVIWSNLPCVNADLNPGAISRAEADRRISLFNATLLPAVTSKAQILDLRGRLCPSDTFTTTVEGIPNARPDGFHLTDVAAKAVADRWLLPTLLASVGR